MKKQYVDFIGFGEEDVTLDDLEILTYSAADLMRCIRKEVGNAKVTSVKVIIRKAGTTEACNITDPVAKTVGIKIEVEE